MNTTHQVGPIFVLASGQRCGSTLLQRFLCSHPQVMIWGEHDGVLKDMFSRFDRLDEWETMFHHMYQIFLERGVNNFIPNMNPTKEYLHRAQEQLLRNLFEEPAQAINRPIWGFKEVLYDASMALDLRRLFPQAKVIHLSRNIFECLISLIHEERIGMLQPYLPSKEVWNRERTKAFIRYWTSINRSFIEMPGLDETWLFSLKYEELVYDTAETTERLIDWLGLEVDQFDYDVFNHKLYTDRPAELEKGDQRPLITRADLSEEERALVLQPEIIAVSEQMGFDMSITEYNQVRK